MKRKTSRRWLTGFLILIIIWLGVAQCSMKYRIPDRKAKEQFANEGVILSTESIKVDGFEMH